MSQKELDIILFGATGFTGKHTIPIIAKFAKTKDRKLTWGLAGRSEKKLKALLNEYEEEIESSKNIPIILADVQDEESLRQMARKALVIINCCGPYRLYGEPVIKACIKEGSHYVDVTGEMQFIAEMQLKYHKKAEEKGVYIINACGFESVPFDLGIVFLEQKFSGTLNSVNAYSAYWVESNSDSSSVLNYGTWESAVHEMGHAIENLKLQKQLVPKNFPKFTPKLKLKLLPHKFPLTNGWVVPFPGTDRPVCERTQRYFYEKEKRRPIQVETYFVLKSFKMLLQTIFFGTIFLLLTQFSFGRNLLLKYPKLFSNGVFSHDNPSEKTVENSRFSVTFYAEGWKENLPEATDQYTVPPNKCIAGRVKGSNPAYGATCVSLVLCAITAITETHKMPREGGVYSPGYAFAKTSLVKLLNENGIDFEVLYEKDLF